MMAPTVRKLIYFRVQVDTDIHIVALGVESKVHRLAVNSVALLETLVRERTINNAAATSWTVHRSGNLRSCDVLSATQDENRSDFRLEMY